MNKVCLNWSEVLYRVANLSNKIYNIHQKNNIRVFGIPRGGTIIAGLMNGDNNCEVVDRIDECNVIVDDIRDTGNTHKNYEKYNKKIYFLIDKEFEFKDEWIIFPWEIVDSEEIQNYKKKILEYFNYDINKINRFMVKK